MQQHPPPIYDSIAPKSKLGSTATLPTASSGQFIGNHANTLHHGSHRPVEYASFDRNTIDYRHLNQNHQQQVPAPLSVLNSSYQQQNHVDLRQHRNGAGTNDEYRLSAGSDLMTNGGPDFSSLSNSSIANQLNGMTMTVTAGPPPVMPRTNVANIKDNNRSHSSRNHIITDSLPGPESCV